jgi:serpin B
MYFILPQKGVTMDEAANELARNFYAWRDSFTRCDVNLALPRFSADYGTSLKEALQALGIEEAFTGAADFSGISDEGLCIGDVLQKTFIKVYEEGAEAAAVTSVMLEATAAGPPVIKNLTLDRPFFYAICARETGSILFIGKCGHPKE